VGVRSQSSRRWFNGHSRSSIVRQSESTQMSRALLPTLFYPQDVSIPQPHRVGRTKQQDSKGGVSSCGATCRPRPAQIQAPLCSRTDRTARGRSAFACEDRLDLVWIHECCLSAISYIPRFSKSSVRRIQHCPSQTERRCAPEPRVPPEDRRLFNNCVQKLAPSAGR